MSVGIYGGNTLPAGALVSGAGATLHDVGEDANNAFEPNDIADIRTALNDVKRAIAMLKGDRNKLNDGFATLLQTQAKRVGTAIALAHSYRSHATDSGWYELRNQVERSARQLDATARFMHPYNG